MTGWLKLFYDVLSEVPMIMLLAIIVISELAIAQWIAKKKKWDETLVSVILLLVSYFIAKSLQL